MPPEPSLRLSAREWRIAVTARFRKRREVVTAVMFDVALGSRPQRCKLDWCVTP